jgi:hypothetical protein
VNSASAAGEGGAGCDSWYAEASVAALAGAAGSATDAFLFIPERSQPKATAMRITGRHIMTEDEICAIMHSLSSAALMIGDCMPGV